MTDAADELLNIFSDEHFSVIEVVLQIANSTTRTEFKTTPPSRLVEITEHGMVLETPARSCANGHNLVIDAVATAPKCEPVRISFTCRVEEVESAKNEGTDRISLSIVQFREEEWNQFRGVFSSRQDEINEFLAAARGYE